MAHDSYLDEINKKIRRSQLSWLFLIALISMVIIALLVIIRRETDFFVSVQKAKTGLSNNERLEIERKILASWAKRDLGLDMRSDIEENLDSRIETEPLSAEERLNIEESLKL